MSEAVEKALDAWFPDEDWRTVGINQDMPTKWRAEMELALRAADAARAVSDEEVVAELRTIGAWSLSAGRDVMIALRAAGMKVVRDV